MEASNIKAMREALIKAITMLAVCEWPDGTDMEGVEELRRDIDAALDVPPRNCDRFTSVKEAVIAFAAEVKNQPYPCPDFTFSTWLLSPVTETKGK